MPTTLKEIATLAGVSIGTVGRVVKNRPGVSPATREKVEQICKELNYSASSVGKALFLQQTENIIAVIINFPTNVFSEDMVSGIRKGEAENQEYNVKFQYFFLKQRSEQEIIDVLDTVFALENLKGIIVRTSDSPAVKQRITELNTRHIPVITCFSDIEDIEKLCFIGPDNKAEGRLAAAMLFMVQQEPIRIGIFHTSLNRLARKQKVEAFKEYVLERCTKDALVFEEEILDDTKVYEQACTVLLKYEVNALFILTDVDQVADAVRDTAAAARYRQFISFTFTTRAEAARLFARNAISFAISEEPYESGKAAADKIVANLLGDTPIHPQNIYNRSEILIPENSIVR